MIVYLGLPRCASTWLYSHFNTNEIKETHYLYTNPQHPVEYVNSRQFDFSTNNWSMDSNIARAIDPYVSRYILTVRNPIDLAISYKTLFNTNQPLEEFLETMIVNKLLCYGDIIERWYNLVNPSKILIYNYNYVMSDNQVFLDDLANKLQIPMFDKVNTNKLNLSMNKLDQPVNINLVNTLKYQIHKFEKITNLDLNYG